MYIPAAFEEKRLDVLHAVMREFSFATLTTCTAGHITVTHIPFVLHPQRGPFGTLLGHVARGNGQWQNLDGVAEAAVLFQGPHAYISPTWYSVHPSVPTWTYVAVHAYGVPKIITDATAFRTLLAETVDLYEASQPTPWRMEVLPDEYTAKMQQQIVGFEMEITRLEGKFKLNQNRNAVDRQLNIEALEKAGDPGSKAIAALMKERLVSTKAPPAG